MNGLQRVGNYYPSHSIRASRWCELISEQSWLKRIGSVKCRCPLTRSLMVINTPVELAGVLDGDEAIGAMRLCQGEDDIAKSVAGNWIGSTCTAVFNCAVFTMTPDATEILRP